MNQPSTGQLPPKNYNEAMGVIFGMRAEIERLRESLNVAKRAANESVQRKRVKELEQDIQEQDIELESRAAEISRLRAEVAELRKALDEAVDYLSTIGARGYCPKANAILAKTQSKDTA